MQQHWQLHMMGASQHWLLHMMGAIQQYQHLHVVGAMQQHRHPHVLKHRHLHLMEALMVIDQFQQRPHRLDALRLPWETAHERG